MLNSRLKCISKLRENKRNGVNRKKHDRSQIKSFYPYCSFSRILFYRNWMKQNNTVPITQIRFDTILNWMGNEKNGMYIHISILYIKEIKSLSHTYTSFLYYFQVTAWLIRAWRGRWEAFHNIRGWCWFAWVLNGNFLSLRTDIAEIGTVFPLNF